MHMQERKDAFPHEGRGENTRFQKDEDVHVNIAYTRACLHLSFEGVYANLYAEAFQYKHMPLYVLHVSNTCPLHIYEYIYIHV